MDLSAWSLYLLITAAIGAAVVLHYRRREPAGRGRDVLALLRTAALAILVLLLFDPRLPASGSGAGTVVALLDASLSMRVPDVDGRTRWERALEELRSIAADRVVLFADGVGVGTGDVEAARPLGTATLLAPALGAALETGAGRVVVITDGAIEDVAEVRRLLASAGDRVEVRRVGGMPAGNLGVETIEAPAWLEVGEETAVRVTVAGSGVLASDSAEVVLRRDGQELARATAAVPPAGALATVTLRFTPEEASSGTVRLTASLEATDAEPDDDHRAAYVRISAQPAGVALVSLRPDQEPRFLLPVLERALGVPVRGWLALPGGRFIRLGAGADAGVVEEEASVRRAVAGADLRVLHGLGADAPSWARDAAGRGALLAFPSGAVDRLPFPVPGLQAGDWYASAELPASPVAPILAGVEPGDAPPLMGLRPLVSPEGAWAPLSARLARRGEPRPVLLAGEVEGRRVAVALGEGYWRWAFSGEAGRDLYERLWSAVAGWLMEGRRGAGRDFAAPSPGVVARGEEVRWLVADAADSLRVAVEPVDDPGVALDTVVSVRAGEAVTPPLPPGRYRYQARGVGGGAEADEPTASGELTVEAYSPEFTRPPVPLAALEGEAGAEQGEDGVPAGGGSGASEAGRVDPGGAAGVRSGTPLHATPWPYALVILLLSAEWILRRRWGLR